MGSLDDWYRRSSMDIADAKARKDRERWEALSSSARADGRAKSVAAPNVFEIIGENELRQAEFERDQSRRQAAPLRGLIDQVVGAVRDFRENYDDMVEADTIGADKYFHCKANCQAARRGPLGLGVAGNIDMGREATATVRKGVNARDFIEDMTANLRGLGGGAFHPEESCSEICAAHRPRALNPKYK